MCSNYGGYGQCKSFCNIGCVYYLCWTDNDLKQCYFRWYLYEQPDGYCDSGVKQRCCYRCCTGYYNNNLYGRAGMLCDDSRNRGHDQCYYGNTFGMRRVYNDAGAWYFRRYLDLIGKWYGICGRQHRHSDGSHCRYRKDNLYITDKLLYYSNSDCESTAGTNRWFACSMCRYYCGIDRLAYGRHVDIG